MRHVVPEHARPVAHCAVAPLVHTVAADEVQALVGPLELLHGPPTPLGVAHTDPPPSPSMQARPVAQSLPMLHGEPALLGGEHWPSGAIVVAGYMQCVPCWQPS